jgi:UDP-N-acetylglucosamine 2-epimerase (hydrolysing)
LKNANFIIGNSSAGIREAPYYGIPVINIGTRQNNRALNENIINCSYDLQSIADKLLDIENKKYTPLGLFGSGNSSDLFFETLTTPHFWDVEKQKSFLDL